ncbi:MAG: hypothetical protein H0W70_16125 [Actinobacteria bacterium]|nr:hypothetical protein [Actinomycetota bacterium]
MLRGEHSRAESAHLACPFCSGYEIDRLYVASGNLDSCECLTCGALWDEERGSGAYLGRGVRSSVLAPRSE